MKYPRIRTGFAAVVLSLIIWNVSRADEPTPLESARPMIGTSAHGHTYPGATVPFGMVQLSPDTRFETWDGCSGYHYSDKAIYGFSHTHLSGTGCKDLGDIRVIPRCDEVRKIDENVYRPQAFSHSDEAARPGRYRVSLGDPKIEAELTATAHAGFHRYTFPAGRRPSLVFDLDRGIGNRTEESYVKIDKSNAAISGYRRSCGWAQDKTFYFVAQFSRPFDEIVAANRDRVKEKDKERDVFKSLPGKVGADMTPEFEGNGLSVRLCFQETDQPLLVKVGISPVSVEAARRNLAAEIPGWDFDAAVAAAEKSWSDYLGRIEIKTSDPAVRETFYSALYHAAMAPTLFNDADGGYRGLDRKAHAPAGFQNYCTFSLWDTFRAEHPLLTIVQPQRVDDFVGSMLAHYREFDRRVLPVWSLAGNETWCMIGNHSIPVIADAYLKGFRGFDAEAVYQAVRATSLQGRNCLDEYQKHGYVPTGRDKESVSRTLEYAYDDWCVAQMAKALGKTEDAKLFEKRSQYYRNVFDASVGFMRGKTADGAWREPFKPNEFVPNDYTEGTAWNYTWFVPQDVSGLIELMGGDEKFVAKLDRLFAEESKLLADIPDLTGLIGQYVHGNEPCQHIAYLYCYAGAPWKTQERVRRIMTDLYDNTVEGICGNDDCGQTSAWYAMSALGLYPVNPASSVYVIGSPMVDRATIRLDPKYHKGESFTIVAENNSPRNIYVQSAALNGKPLERTWLSHAEIVGGGELVLKMGPKPNEAWGRRPQDRPPAIAPEVRY